MTSKITVEYKEEPFYYKTILLNDIGEEIGEFRLNKILNDKHPHDLEISIEDDYRGKGLSKLLIKEMCKNLKGIIAEDTFLYIDTDASWEPDRSGNLKSYWDYLGMEETPEEDPYHGYEKRIRLGDLCKKVSGGRKNKTKKTRKYKKRRKTRKRKL